MNLSHIAFLRCPKTKRLLQLQSFQVFGNRIKEGRLTEPVSGNQYPIVNFIPRFVNDDNYASSFGLEWNLHSRTQYDEASGFDISGKRFREETGWPSRLIDEIILEAGSGSGRFTKHAVDTGAMVISFDYSNAVEANYKSNEHNDNLLIVQASLYEMPFEDNYFDRVFCFGVLQHTPNPSLAFRCLVQSVKVGGHISSDIYRKSFSKVFLSPKYLIRKFTRRMKPERLYRLTVRYVDFMWPVARFFMKVPKIGKMINWRLMIADYSYLLSNAKEEVLKEWAVLDTFDMVSPKYDYPATMRTFRKWHVDAGLRDIEINYGYNGIEGRAIK